MLLGFLLGVFASGLCIAIVIINAQDFKLEVKVNETIKKNEEDFENMVDDTHIPRID